MKVTDTLSRTSLQDNTAKISDKEMNYFVHFVMSFLPVSEKSRQKLVTEIAKDDTQQKLRHQISAGWPERYLNLDPCLKPYHYHNLEVTYQDGLLLKSQQIIVPSTLRPEMHKIVHQDHLGIEQNLEPDDHSSGQTWVRILQIRYQTVRYANNTKTVKVLYLS